MATSRRKTPGFTTLKKEEEIVSVEHLLEESAKELLEAVSQIESEVEAHPKAKEPFIEQEITPTEDHGPRFVEKDVTSTPALKSQPAAPTPPLQPRPKRHPRNIPKFSRFR